MKLLLCIDNLAWGGAQRQMSNLAIGLADRGHEVDLFLYYPEHDHFGPAVRAAGVHVIEAPKRRRFDLAPAFALIRRARLRRYDALVAFMPTPATYAIAASLLAGGIPVVVSERGFSERSGTRTFEHLRRQPYRWATHVTTNSHRQAEELLTSYPWLSGRVSTIWNGVDTKRFQTAAPSERADGRLRLLAIGSVKPIKQVELLAQALVVLARRDGPPVLVEWAGKLLQDPDSKAVREHVDAMLASARLSDRWRWLGLQDDVAGVLRRSHALVHPNWREGLSNAICEALASGLPVVAPRGSDHELLLGRSGERGFLCEPGDAESLAAAIARLAALDPSERASLGKRARSFAEQHLSLGSFVGAYESLLVRLVAERARAGVVRR